jgi:cell wall assembly regulator SMI1
MKKIDGNLEIENIWNDIKEWYRKKCPDRLEDLNEGASAQQLADLENAIGLRLPDDYKASLKIHNGDCYMTDYSYMSIDGVLRKWSMMKRLRDKGTFKESEIIDGGRQIIQNTWWHPGWIPFAEDGGGNMICIDMDPEVNGVQGQILYMETQAEGPIISNYKSFLEWIESYKNDLYDGKYEVDEYGYLNLQ